MAHVPELLIKRRDKVRAADPTMFILMFAVWSLSNGTSLLLTDDAFGKQVLYAVARHLGWPEDAIGAGMVVDAFLLVLAIGKNPSAIMATIIFLSGILWLLWSISLVFGGLSSTEHYFSASGMYGTIGSIALLLAPKHYLIANFRRAPSLSSIVGED